MDSTRVAKMSEKFLKRVLKIFSDESIPHDSKEKNGSVGGVKELDGNMKISYC